jgi:hypothetical protein
MVHKFMASKVQYKCLNGSDETSTRNEATKGDEQQIHISMCVSVCVCVCVCVFNPGI